MSDKSEVKPWRMDSEGWLYEERPQIDNPIVEYDGCGSHAADWRSDHAKALATYAPVMWDLIQRIATCESRQELVQLQDDAREVVRDMRMKGAKSNED